jgi:hypothetical protein
MLLPCVFPCITSNISLSAQSVGKFPVLKTDGEPRMTRINTDGEEPRWSLIVCDNSRLRIAGGTFLATESLWDKDSELNQIPICHLYHHWRML